MSNDLEVARELGEISTHLSTLADGQRQMAAEMKSFSDRAGAVERQSAVLRSEFEGLKGTVAEQGKQIKEWRGRVWRIGLAFSTPIVAVLLAHL